jgi:RNA polymerase sigma factor (sigma-70 family)
MTPQPPVWPPDEWYHRLREHDPEAWQYLYRSCLRRCRSILRDWPSAEIDPEDAAQQVFKEVIERLDTWDQVVSMQAFVHTRAKWRCQNLMRVALRERDRRVAVRTQNPFDPEASPLDQLPAPAAITQALADLEQLPQTTDAAKAHVYAVLHACIKQLKAVDQAILALWMQGTQPAQISPALQPPRTTNYVSVHLHRMQQKYLPTCLERNGIALAEIMRIWGTQG